MAEEYDYEEEERRRLISQINSVQSNIARLERENAQLEIELDNAIESGQIAVENCKDMSKAVKSKTSGLKDHVGKAAYDASDLFYALTETVEKFLNFKTISTASKELTKLADDYEANFSHYNDLRRITLGFVIGADLNIISDEVLRSTVEKAYLQNTDYWLAYAIMAVMLWYSDEKEAAERALSKSLSINYHNSCLFFLLIALRFNRIDTAKRWYKKYLEITDSQSLTPEWQYLIQAYLYGAFGADAELSELVEQNFKDLLDNSLMLNTGYREEIIKRTVEFAEKTAHVTHHEFLSLKRTCSQYDSMLDLLSQAEKNELMADSLNKIYNETSNKGKDLPQRIESVLYSLVNDYDVEEEKNIAETIYNNCIVAARGDMEKALESYKMQYRPKSEQKASMDKMLLEWAFSYDNNKLDISIKKFAVNILQEEIKQGYTDTVNKYRQHEKQNYDIDISGCVMNCNENDMEPCSKKVKKHLKKQIIKEQLTDKAILLSLCGIMLSLILFLVLIGYFHGLILTFAILVLAVSSVVLGFYVSQYNKIYKQRCEKALLLLKETLTELAQWRQIYKEADLKANDLFDAIDKFNLTAEEQE